MSLAPLSVLVLGPSAPGCVSALQAAGFDVSQRPEGSPAHGADAVLLWAPDAAALAALLRRSDLPPLAFDHALVVLGPAGTPVDTAAEDTLLSLGVEALLPADEAALPRAVRQAVLRKRHERQARNAYATDLATGLPHQAQLLEHMTQLLALRERVPAPMVLLVLRVEGYAAAATRLGAEAANVLRRKVAVRLRTGLRAGDVVAAVGPDAFGVLLGHLEAQADGERVAAKLLRTLQQPLVVAGQPCPVQASVGIALFPAHGKDAQSLLQRAIAQANSVGTVGREGYAVRTERGPAAAANDEDA
ncbi:GGDEF domain-containing protein [Rubrivivax rivuli]|uniref:GGDEF domain-containing protein n=1 Tax=Rubrivivax rivuli TaxID=1862385 RepID=A0A437RCX2_9BURK|nr:GGDEF domain-containing protein [Rubrivivax rivuli]RVU44592.1 GGDEF domain-containing protein [Rubrivivax rivuli]